jgi:hypothetical protein
LLGIIFTEQLFSILLHLKPNIPTSPLLPSTWLVTISHFTPKLAAILLWHIHIKFNLKLNKCQEPFKSLEREKHKLNFENPFHCVKLKKRNKNSSSIRWWNSWWNDTVDETTIERSYTNGLEGSHTPRTYIEQIQLERLVNEVMVREYPTPIMMTSWYVNIQHLSWWLLLQKWSWSDHSVGFARWLEDKAQLRWGSGFKPQRSTFASLCW